MLESNSTRLVSFPRPSVQSKFCANLCYQMWDTYLLALLAHREISKLLKTKDDPEYS